MSGATVLDVACSPFLLDPRRAPPLSPMRATPYRTREGEARHDAVALLADCFRDAAGGLRAVGPPLPPAWRADGALRAWATATREPVAVERLPHRHVMLPQHYRIAATGGDGLLLAAGGQVEVLTPQPYLGRWFAGRRVLMAVVRDNWLRWVADWTRFHAFHHGVDAVLLFDNGSVAYRTGDLARAVAAVPGIAVVAAVPWVVGHGSSSGRLGWSRLDMNHGQAVAFALARERFLAEAAWVLNADIDELVVPLGVRRIDDLFATSGAAVVSFPLLDLFGPAGAAPDPPRHADALLATEPAHFGRPKWAAVPARCPGRAAWGVHVVDDAATVATDPAEFVIAHCLPLTTGWGGRGGRRHGIDRRAPGVTEQAAIGARMAEAFAGWEPQAEAWLPPQTLGTTPAPDAAS